MSRGNYYIIKLLVIKLLMIISAVFYFLRIGWTLEKMRTENFGKNNIKISSNFSQNNSLFRTTSANPAVCGNFYMIKTLFSKDRVFMVGVEKTVLLARIKRHYGQALPVLQPLLAHARTWTKLRFVVLVSLIS